MTPIDIDTALAWRGQTVRDAEGEKIGTFGDVFLDSQTDVPAWGGVRTGLFGRNESFVPLSAVEERDGDLVVPYPAKQVTGAPHVDPDVSLSPEEEQALYTHYDEEYGTAAGTPPPAPEGEMVRSEEEAHFEEGPLRPTERVRLKKVLVTHHETRTVPVRKEVVQLETEPPPPGAIDAGPASS